MAPVLALICAFGLLGIALYRFTLTINRICDDNLAEHMNDSPHSDPMP